MTTIAYPVVSVAGEPALASSIAQWTLRPGVEPAIEEFDFAPGSRTALEKLAGGTIPTVLAINGTSYSAVYVVREDFAANENLYRVLVADRRYLWHTRHVHWRYNLRRRVGVQRRTSWDVAEPIVDPLVPEFAWRKWTLAPTGDPWTPVEAIRHVMQVVDPGARLVIDPQFGALQVPIEDFELDDPGNTAVSRLLHYLPGGQVTVDPDGAVRFFFQSDGSERATRAALAPEIVGGGHAILLGATLDRPSKVRVLFSYETELRFDFVDDAAADADAAAVIDPGIGVVTPRRLDNVVQLPDHTLTLVGGGALAQGTWLSFAEAWDAWIAGDPPTGSIGTAIRDSVRFAFIPEIGLWSALDLWGRFDRRGMESGSFRNWSARVSAIQQHYRTSFRIPRDWMDRIHVLMDSLISTIDRVSGQRGNAVAFGGHAIRPSQKGFFLEYGRSGSRGLQYAFNVPGYPGTTTTPITAANKPAPCVVSIADQDQGILRLDYRLSPFGIEDLVWPSMLENVPTRDPNGHYSEPTAWNATADGNGGTLPRLAASHAVAVLLSAVPATTRLYEILVEPKDVLDLLPGNVRDRVGDTSRGPVVDLRIAPGIERARVRWVDEPGARDAVEAIYYPEKLEALRADPARRHATLSELIRPYVMNDAPQAALGDRAASLPALARAAAAAVWARWATRPIGAVTGPYDGAQVLRGATSALAHQVRPDGTSVTQATFAPALEPLSMWGLLDASTRRIVMRTMGGNL